MDSYWPYLGATIVVSIILTLAVIGGYEVCRNIELHARERRIERARKAAQRAQSKKGQA